jgi:hypothetical protein
MTDEETNKLKKILFVLTLIKNKESDERKLAYLEAIEEAIEHAKELLGIKVKL